MVSIVDISSEQAEAVLSRGEDHFHDYKAIEVKPAKITEFVSAFANAAGGEIHIGIDEEKDDGGKPVMRWRGFSDAEDANSVIHALEAMKPLGSHYTATLLRCAGRTGLVLQIELPKSTDILYASNGSPYIRKNASKLKVDGADALRRLQLDKGVVTFEDDTVSADLTDITNSLVINQFMLSVIPTVPSPEEWMKKQRLIVGDKATVSGVMLFHDEPQSLLPKRSAVKIYRYKTRDEEGTREQLDGQPITIDGCAYNMIYDAVAKTKEIIQGISKLGESGLEQVRYPDETLHEIITNAVLHRDYSIAADIHIRIYDNRVEVQSPGKLPGHVTTANILREQSARNPRIVRLINRFPNAPNKDVGEGLNTAFEAMKALRLKDPEIQETDTSVIINIRHAPLASPHDAVMKYLEVHAEITNRIGRELTGIRSENSMKEVFLGLNKRQMIERVPEKRGNKAAWQKWTGTVFAPPSDDDDEDC